MLDYSRIVKIAEEQGIVIFIHMNDFDYYKNDLFLDIVKTNPNVNFIILHLGFLQDGFLSALCRNDNLYLETSALNLPLFSNILVNFSEKLIDKDFFKKILSSDNLSISLERIILELDNLIGSEKILFGSDEPWSSLEGQIKFFNNLELEHKKKRNILYNNARKVLGIK